MNVKDRLEHVETAGKMMDDPDLKGDTLLLSLAILHVCYARQEAGRRAKLRGKFWPDVLLAAGWSDHYSARAAASNDVPRFEPPSLYTRPACQGSMIRREGVCGKPGQHTTLRLYDPETGAWDWVGGCSRHWPEIDGRARASRKEWEANGKPTLPNNKGGVMLRYFATEGIEAMYRWARPTYTGATDLPPATIPRPKLTVIRGGLE